MSSQDSEGESYVADYIANPKVYGDVEHYGWTTEEEEDYDPKVYTITVCFIASIKVLLNWSPKAKAIFSAI
jgi:hypothetical protein